MVAGCGILVGISYLMLDVLSNMVVVPQTPIQELDNQGEMMVSLPQANLFSMQVSVDGQFLAFIQDNGQGASGTLKVLYLKQDMGQLVSQSIQGQQLAWLGTSDDLVYEDHGDIFRLNLPNATSRNLTASDEYDSKPLPSPDGKSVMWTRRPLGGGGGGRILAGGFGWRQQKISGSCGQASGMGSIGR